MADFESPRKSSGSSGIQETATNQSSSGGKGLPGPTTTVYTYTVSFAFAFCEGPAAVTRIWGDSRLIYDTTSKGAVSSNTLDTGLDHQSGAAITEVITPTIYPGNETQLPDPTYQAAVGINQASAMRGMCYGVYIDFPLADFGNRLPNIRGEIATNSALAYVKDTYPPNLIPDPDGTTRAWQFPYVDSINRVAVLLDGQGYVGARIDLATDDTAPLQRWQPSTVYALGDQVLDSSGNVQTVFSVSGPSESGTVEPVWNVGGVGVETADHDFYIVWINTGAGPEAIVVTSQLKINPFIGSGGSVINPPQYLPLSAGVDTRGYLWECWELYNGVSTQYCLTQIDATTFQAVAQVVLPSWVRAINFANILGEDLVYAVTDTNVLYVIKSKGASIKSSISVIPSTNSGSIYGSLYPAIDPNTGICYIVSTPAVSGSSSPYEYNVTVVDPRGTPTATAYQFFGNSTTEAGQSCFFDGIDSSLLVATYTGYLVKIPISSWTVSVTSSAAVMDGGGSVALFIASWYSGIVPSQGILYLPDEDVGTGYPNLNYVNHATLAIEQTVDQSSWFSDTWDGLQYAQYDPATQSIVGTTSGGSYAGFPERMYLNRQEVASETLDQIVLDLCERAGLDSSLVDVTALATTDVLGYCITRNSDAKSAIAPLVMAYLFGAVESDFVLKFVPRGGAVAMTIPESDLGLESDGDELEETFAQEHDLPKLLDVLYADPAQDYQTGKQSRNRNARVVTTKNHSILELPLTMDGDTAAQIADKTLRVIWDERNQYGFKLFGSKYLVLDATDIVAFGYKGSSYIARIAKTTVGQDRVIEVAAMSEDSHSYTSVQTGQLSPGFPPQILNPAAPSTLYVMDLPLFEDTDAAPDGSSGYYFAMSSSQTGWPGAVIQQSQDGSNYEQVGFSSTPIVFGTVGIATPAPPAPSGADVLDTTTTINVKLPMGGTLSSTTLLNVLNGANAFVLGDEIMQFQTATLNADGSYTLSNLARGRRGTEWACGLHTTGEIALFIPTGLKRNIVPLSQIGLAQYFRVATIGQTPSASGVQDVTLQGNDLKPLSPCSIAGARDGSNNLTLTWLRRTRLGGEQDWLDGVTNVPLGEDSEAYSVDVVVSGVVVRTFNGLTSATVVYSAAEQTTDGITPGNPVTVNVYQISAQVGRGFAGAATV